jgi:hypothetical protein
MQDKEFRQRDQSKRPKILILANREALSGKISGASLRLESVHGVCSELGAEIHLKKASLKSVKSSEKYDLIVFCSFSVIWTLNFFRYKGKDIWIDFTDTVLGTFGYQIRMHYPFRKIGSSLRALITVLALRKVKVISYISPRDLRRDLRLLVKKTDAFYVFPNQPVHFTFSQSQESRFIFMGTLKYLPNSRGLFTLLDFLIQNNHEHLVRKIHVFGEVSPPVRSQYPNVHWHGYNDYLANQQDVHIAPILEGAGIKNKVANPIFNGLRVITTIEGANGLIPQENLNICTSLEEFTAAMLNADKTEFDVQQLKNLEFEKDQRNELLRFLRDILGLTGQENHQSNRH